MMPEPSATRSAATAETAATVRALPVTTHKSDHAGVGAPQKVLICAA